MSLLPDLSLPATRTLRSSMRSSADDLEAIVVLAAPETSAEHFSRLPHAVGWKRLHFRAPAQSGTTRSAGFAGDTLAVLGYVARDASRFAQLTIAGKLLADAAARKPRRLALAVVGLDGDASGLLEALLAAAYAHAFRLPRFRSTKDPDEVGPIARIDLLDATTIDLARTQACARGNNLARWLTALPPSELDAPAYRRALGKLARERSITMRWLDERALRKLGAGAFLAVAAGNPDRTAGIAHLSYRPVTRRRPVPLRAARSARSRAADVALIGKGILFDTGGINLKPHRGMLDMHTDMAGSAVAVATLFALAELRAPVSADAWLPITENRIGPTAYRPQDIVRAANGTTIQIIHTDAEGRLVLADTLALAGAKAPKLMLDFATLTGTCEYALTDRMSGVFTNRPALVETLLGAGRSSGERVWNFPMDPDYDSDIESRVADIAQCAVESKGDHIHAARFLSRFVPENVAWAHYDLSSAVRRGGLAQIPTDITGFGVRYALELLLEHRVLDKLQSAP